MTPPIAFLVSAASANANTVAIATPQAGDLIVVFAYNNASTTVPTLVAGYTSLFSTTGANTNAHQLAYKVAAGSETNIGTWTNATGVVVQIVRAPLGSTPTGGIANGGSTGTSMSYTGITCTDLGGTSTLLAFGGHRTATNVGATAPTGMATSTSATSIAGFFEQNAAAFSTSAVTVNASSGYRFAVVEIRSATPLVQAVSNDASAASVTVTLGANVTLGNTLSLITSFTAGTCVVSDNLGNVWMSRPAVSIASFGSDFQQRFLAPVTAAGAITVTITATGSAAVSGNLSEWMGAWQFDAGNATNDALGGGTSTSPASVSVTPAVGRAVVLGWEENASAGTATAGLGYTLLSQTPAGKIATAFQYQGPKPIATTAKFTIASALWAATAGILVPVPEPPLLAPRAAPRAAALALAWTAVWSVQSTPLPLAALIPPPAPITAPPLPSPPLPWSVSESWRPVWTVPIASVVLPLPASPAPLLLSPPVPLALSESWRADWSVARPAWTVALLPITVVPGVPPLLSSALSWQAAESWRPDWSVAPRPVFLPPAAPPVVNAPPFTRSIVPWAIVESWRPDWPVQSTRWSPAFPVQMLGAPLVRSVASLDSWRAEWTVSRGAFPVALFLPVTPSLPPLTSARAVLLESWRPDWTPQRTGLLLAPLRPPGIPPLLGVRPALWIAESWRAEWIVQRPAQLVPAQGPGTPPLFAPSPWTLLESWRVDWPLQRRPGAVVLFGATPYGIVIRAIDLSGLAARATDFSDVPSAAIDQSHSVPISLDESGDR